MHLNGRPMTLLFESADLGDRCTRELTNPELADRRRRRHHPQGERSACTSTPRSTASVREVLTFRNFSREHVGVTLTLAYGSDFDDIFTVRGMAPGRGAARRPARATVVRSGSAYVGADHRRRTTEITFDPPPPT